MPPRLVSLTIVAFWLGMLVWLFFRDLWPSVRPGEPPRYTIMASEEAARQGSPVRWNVFRDGVHLYDLETRTTYHERGEDGAIEDSFEMRAFARAVKPPDRKAPVRRLRSFIRIGRDGELRAVNAQLHLVVAEWEVLIDVEGQVLERQVLPCWRVKAWPKDEFHSEERVFDRESLSETAPEYQFETPFPPLEFAERGIVLNPLHPPNRLDTLRPEQQWRMPLVGSVLALEAAAHVLEALARQPRLENIPELVSPLVGHALDSMPLLASRVLPETEPLPLSSQPPSCWVVEAGDAGDAVRGRLWVQQSEGERKGLVLRQEIVVQTSHGETSWVVERER